MENEIDKSPRALKVSGNFQFWHYRMDDQALNINVLYDAAAATNLQIQN